VARFFLCGEILHNSPYRNSNPDVLMVEPTKHRPSFDTPMALNGPSVGRILSQPEVRAYCVIIIHVARKHVAKVPLACHHHVVQAFQAYRADQALGTRVVPWRACRYRMIANAKRANSPDEYTAEVQHPADDYPILRLTPTGWDLRQGQGPIFSPKRTCTKSTSRR